MVEHVLTYGVSLYATSITQVITLKQLWASLPLQNLDLHIYEEEVLCGGKTSQLGT